MELNLTMKKLLLVLSLLWPTVAAAQCNGVFPANTLCGNPGASPAPPAAFSASGTVVGPGSSIINDIATWANTGGTQLKDSGISLGSQTENEVLATPNGSSGAPSFRALVYPDLPGIGTSTVLGNFSGSTTTPSAQSVPSCPSDGVHALTNSAGSGFNCTALSSQSTVTGSPTINAGSCQYTVSWSGAFGTIVLPAASGFAAPCTITICNTNLNNGSTHAALLSGFPSGSLPHLWPGQCVSVQLQGSAWQTVIPQPLFRPNFGVVCYADNTGSNTNDGLVSNASTNAVLDPQQCIITWRAEFDRAYVGQPTICLTGGQTYNQNTTNVGIIFLQTWPVVINLETCIGSTPSTLRTLAGNVVVEENDFGGYIIFAAAGTAGIILDCTNAMSHPCYGLYLHQQNGFDIYNVGGPSGAQQNGVTINGAGSDDYGIWCDSLCKGNIDDPVFLSGTFSQFIFAEVGSHFIVSNGIVSNSATAAIAFYIAQQSSLQWSGELNMSSGLTVTNTLFWASNLSNIVFAGSFGYSGSISGSPVSFYSLNGSVLCNGSGTAFPGSTGQTTLSGWTAGAAIASGGACAP